jgi:hypothetical protein
MRQKISAKMRSVPRYGSALFHNGINSGAVLLARAASGQDSAVGVDLFLTAEYLSFSSAFDHSAVT